MKVAGIIAEYNPFHNGHKYQIETLRQMGFEYIVIVMSGDFVQRGAPAIIDKYTRAEIALQSGADLVLELPTIYATASAEIFAKGGVSLLEGLSCVSHLCFGAECDDLSLLQTIANFLKSPTVSFDANLKALLKEGNSYPLARAKALVNQLKKQEEFSHLSETALEEILSSPNNILAIEYLKATKLTPILIPRKGAHYHDTELSPFASATAIRFALEKEPTQFSYDIKDSIPKEALPILEKYFSDTPAIFPKDLSSFLSYKLLLQGEKGFIEYADSSPELSAKIQKNKQNCDNFKAFAQTLKSKEVTLTRINRLLLHIILDIKNTDYEEVFLNRQTPVLYARPLAFRKSASSLLSEIKKKANIPFISKVADAPSILNDKALFLFQKDLFASDFYNQILWTKGHIKKANDYIKKIAME